MFKENADLIHKMHRNYKNQFLPVKVYQTLYQYYILYMRLSKSSSTYLTIHCHFLYSTIPEQRTLKENICKLFKRKCFKVVKIANQKCILYSYNYTITMGFFHAELKTMHLFKIPPIAFLPIFNLLHIQYKRLVS